MEDAIRITVVSEAEELREIATLADEIWHEHYGKLLSPEQIAYMLEKFQSEEALARSIREEHYTYYAIRAGERLVGFCGVCPHEEERELFLSKLYIHKDFRGKKIATLVLEMLKERCLSEGLDAIWLTVNKYNSGSIAAYQKLGFRTVDAIVTDIGHGYVMDDYKMRYSIRGGSEEKTRKG